MTNNNTCSKCKYFNTCGDAERVAPCAGYERITRTDIINNIDEIRAEIKTLKNYVNTLRDTWRASFEEYKTVKNTDGNAAAVIGKKMSTLKEDEERARNMVKDHELYIKILRHNYRIILFDEAVPGILETLKKYNGRAYGEKTRAKIRDEIREKYGVYFYINSRSWCDELCISDEYTRYNEEIIARGDADGEYKHFLIDNKINAPELETLTFYDNSFVDNVLERIRAIKEARENAKKTAAAAREAINNYNDLLVVNIDHAYFTEKNLY